MARVPNTVCKNRDCTKGKDGGRKHYFACRYCTHSENWRAVACSWECYLEFQKQLTDARSKGLVCDPVPERIDMSRDEVEALIQADTNVVADETCEELQAEIEEFPGLGFGDLVDLINERLDAED